MFHDLQPIQVFNAITNLMGLFIVVPLIIFLINMKRRLVKRFDYIETHLDNILLLANEVYQSDKEKKVVVLDQKDSTTSTGTLSSAPISRSKL